MEYLGRLSGRGVILHNGLEISSACFEFDGFLTTHAGVICNGEIQMSVSMLKAVFPLRTMQLRTDEGRMLECRFSDKKIGPGQEAAHVDVTGEIPGDDKCQWRRRYVVDRLPPD
ncbi:MAG: hypothetical protein AAF299_02675 [Pseudomonadota bacterium]